MVGLYRCRWLLVSALLARLVTQENLMLFFDPAAERPFPIFAQSAQFYHHPVAQAWWYGTHSCCFDGIIGIQLVCVVSAFFPRCEHRFKQRRWKSSQSWCLARSFCLVQGRQARVYGEADHSNCQCVSSSNRGIWSWSKISADAWVVRLGDGMVHIIHISHQYGICTDLSSFRMESNQKKNPTWSLTFSIATILRKSADAWMEDLFGLVVADSKILFTHVVCLLRHFWRVLGSLHRAMGCGSGSVRCVFYRGRWGFFGVEFEETTRKRGWCGL